MDLKKMSVYMLDMWEMHKGHYKTREYSVEH